MRMVYHPFLTLHTRRTPTTLGKREDTTTTPTVPPLMVVVGHAVGVALTGWGCGQYIEWYASAKLNNP